MNTATETESAASAAARRTDEPAACWIERVDADGGRQDLTHPSTYPRRAPLQLPDVRLRGLSPGGGPLRRLDMSQLPVRQSFTRWRYRGDDVSVEIEIARIELELAQDAESVTAAQVLRWLRSRPMVGTAEVVAAVERATRAIGHANRLLSS